MVLPRTDPYTRINLSELGHDGKQLIIDDLFRADFGVEVCLCRAENDRYTDTHGSEMREPEKGDSFIAVIVGVKEEDDIAFL